MRGDRLGGQQAIGVDGRLVFRFGDLDVVLVLPIDVLDLNLVIGVGAGVADHAHRLVLVEIVVVGQVVERRDIRREGDRVAGDLHIAERRAFEQPLAEIGRGVRQRGQLGDHLAGLLLIAVARRKEQAVRHAVSRELRPVAQLAGREADAIVRIGQQVGEDVLRVGVVNHAHLVRQAGCHFEAVVLQIIAAAQVVGAGADVGDALVGYRLGGMVAGEVRPDGLRVGAELEREDAGRIGDEVLVAPEGMDRGERPLAEAEREGGRVGVGRMAAGDFAAAALAAATAAGGLGVCDRCEIAVPHQVAGDARAAIHQRQGHAIRGRLDAQAGGNRVNRADRRAATTEQAAHGVGSLSVQKLSTRPISSTSWAASAVPTLRRM